MFFVYIPYDMNIDKVSSSGVAWGDGGEGWWIEIFLLHFGKGLIPGSTNI